MQKYFKQLTLASLALLSSSESQGGVNAVLYQSQTPQMGWSTWYALGCEEMTADKIKEQAELILDTGLHDVGFEYILVDDCWQSRGRNQLGFLDADKKRFPNGFKEISNYVHERAMLVGK